MSAMTWFPWPDSSIYCLKRWFPPDESLLDVTTKHLLDTLQLSRTENTQSEPLLTKWGCDESSGHSQYNQKFDDKAAYFVMTSPNRHIRIIVVQLKLLFKNKLPLWWIKQQRTTENDNCFIKPVLLSTIGDGKSAKYYREQRVRNCNIYGANRVKWIRQWIIKMLMQKIISIICLHSTHSWNVSSAYHIFLITDCFWGETKRFSEKGESSFSKYRHGKAWFWQ